MRKAFALIAVVAAAIAVFGVVEASQARADPPATPQGAAMLQDFQGWNIYTSLDGCKVTDVAINFSHPMQQSPGEHATEGWVWVISENYCTYQPGVSVSGVLSDATLKLTPNAKYAHAVGKGLLQNYDTGTSSLVSVDVTFVPKTVEAWTQDPHHSFVHVATSEGEATGSVTVDGVNYLKPVGENSDQRFTVDAWLRAPIAP